MEVVVPGIDQVLFCLVVCVLAPGCVAMNDTIHFFVSREKRGMRLRGVMVEEGAHDKKEREREKERKPKTDPQGNKPKRKKAKKQQRKQQGEKKKKWRWRKEGRVACGTEGSVCGWGGWGWQLGARVQSNRTDGTELTNGFVLDGNCANHSHVFTLP